MAENETGLTSPLISTPSLPTQPMKGCTTSLGSTPPTLYEQQCWFFYVPQELEQWMSCEMAPTVFCPYPRRLECLTNCRCHIKGSTFSSVILRPYLLVLPGFEPPTSRSTDRRLSNWANRAAVINFTHKCSQVRQYPHTIKTRRFWEVIKWSPEGKCFDLFDQIPSIL